MTYYKGCPEPEESPSIECGKSKKPDVENEDDMETVNSKELHS